MSTIKADNIATLAGVSTSMSNAVNGSAKAWVNFNGTGTVAIRRAFNVSSISDNGTGNYTVNFTTAMPDADYAITGTASGASFNGFIGVYPGLSPATSSVRGATQIYNNALVDQNNSYVAIFS